MELHRQEGAYIFNLLPANNRIVLFQSCSPGSWSELNGICWQIEETEMELFWL